MTVLAIILSPALPMLQGLSFAGLSPAPAVEDLEDQVPDREPEITDQEYATCISLNSSVDDLLGIESTANGTQNNKIDDKKIAADLLVGEYCTRSELINETSAFDNPGISLVALACNAAQNQTSDLALNESLEPYGPIYCAGARTAILNETGLLREDVESYRADILPALKEEEQQNMNNSSAQTNGTSLTITEQMEVKLNEITADLDSAQSNIDTDTYASAKLLDSALKRFAEVLQLEEEAAGISPEEPA